MAEGNTVEETVKRLTAHKGVEGVMILTGEGILIRSTLDSTLSAQYASWVSAQSKLWSAPKEKRGLELAFMLGFLTLKPHRRS